MIEVPLPHLPSHKRIIRPKSAQRRALLAMLLLGCLSTTACAASTPAPTAPPTTTRWPTPSPWPKASPYQSQTPVPTVTATDQPEPVAVGISPREAEREVLSWLDPTRSPRIEWSHYVRRHDYELAAEEAADFPITRDAWGYSVNWFPIASLPDVVLVVAASTRGIDRIGVPGQLPRQTLQYQTFTDAVSPDRQRIIGVFDPFSGERLAAYSLPLVDQWHSEPASEEVGRLDAMPALRYQLAPPLRRPSPTAWPVPTEVPQPDPTEPTPGERLTWAKLPPDLTPTFRAYPLAPGSSWTWRLTDHQNDVLWTAAIVTETVDAAWLDGDTAVVRSHLDVYPLTPGRSNAVPGPRYRYVSPRVIIGKPGDLPSLYDDIGNYRLSDMDECSSADSPFAEGGIAAELTHDTFGNPRHLGVGIACIREGPTTITTPAGTFDGCWKLDIIGGAQWGSIRWFCPGVGPVAFSLGGAGSFHAYTQTANLLRWRRATLPER